jgi:esterase/lipase
MTPAELRELADRAEAEAVRLCGLSMGVTPVNIGQAETANRLFLMARNLRERADELKAEEFREAFRRSQPKPGEFVTL